MGLNWGAIGLAAIVHWLFGAVWFTVFSKPWQAGLRLAPEELQQYASHPNFWPYLFSFICNLVIAYVIARILSAYNSYGMFRGISVGLLVGLAAAVAMATELAFEQRTSSFILISVAYPLIGCIVMGLILGVWKPKGYAGKAGATAK